MTQIPETARTEFLFKFSRCFFNDSPNPNKDSVYFPVEIFKIQTVIKRSTFMPELSRITINPELCGGRPCIRGMRIRVKDILDLMASGANREEILADYPYLETDDIDAALAYAAKQMDHAILSVA
jgi:uncharacterized protein (DUF433 family)